MLMLETAAAVFLGLHLLIAGTRARDAITGVIGERVYLILFSLASIAAIVWLVMTYNAAQAGSENYLVYDLGRGVHDLGIVVIAIAFIGLGQVMGRAFDEIPNRVGAYTVNVLGSLVGIVAFFAAMTTRAFRRLHGSARPSRSPLPRTATPSA